MKKAPLSDGVIRPMKQKISSFIKLKKLFIRHRNIQIRTNLCWYTVISATPTFIYKYSCFEILR